MCHSNFKFLTMEYFFVFFLMIHAAVAIPPFLPSTLTEFLPAATAETNIWTSMESQYNTCLEKVKYEQKSKVTEFDNFFHEFELQVGKNITLRLKDPIKANTAKFLSASAAEKIPFSSKNLVEILQFFSLKQNSSHSKLVKDTIEVCEGTAIYGENKYCSSTLESFLDSAVAILGGRIELVSTDYKKTKARQFIIGKGMKKIEGPNVVCHKMPYPYAVFYCHSFPNTVVYKIPLEAKDGSTVNAMAVCHEQTSSWDPGYPAFKVLKAKPGLPVCHLLRKDGMCQSMAWVVTPWEVSN